MFRVAIYTFSLVVLFAVVACHHTPQAVNAATVVVNGKDYTSGLVWVKSARDTTELAIHGFSHFSKPYYADSTTYFVAWWPKKQNRKVLSKAVLNLQTYGLNKQDDSVFVVKPVRASGALERPGDGYKGAVMNGVEWAGGYVTVTSSADTALLKSLGFWNIWFDAAGSGGVRYSATWPLDLPWDYLPPQILNLYYPPPPRPNKNAE
jgi:hypothetical protein